MVTRVDKYLGGLGIDATGKFEVTDNATAVVGNGTTTGNVYAGTINSGGVELRANDYATLLSARSNDYSTYMVAKGGIDGANTSITNLQTGLTGSNTRLAGAEANVIALQGGISGSNTRISGGEANVIALQGGIAGTNTNLSGNVAIFTGAFSGSNTRLAGTESNVIALQSGLSGSNTRLAGAESNVIALQGGLSGTNTTVATKDTVANVYATWNYLNSNVVSLQGGISGSNTRITNLEANTLALQGGISGSNTRLAGAESNVIALQGGLAGANTINTNQTTGLTGANTNITNLQTGLSGANTNITAITGSPVTFQSDVTIRGNLTLTGNTTIVTANTISFGDTLLSLGANNTTSDIVDIGLYGHYWNGTANSHTGIVRSANTKDWMIFANYTIDLEGNSTINMSNSSFALGNLRIRTANASQDVYAANSILGSNVLSNGVELRANDYATYLMAKGGIDAANTSIATKDSVANVYATWNYLNSNVVALQGGISGSNTRLAGAESNVIALQGGLSGANTNITAKAPSASPTFTGNAIFDTNTLFVDSLNKRVGLITTLPGFTLDVRGTANTGAFTGTSVSSAGVELRANDYATYLVAAGGISGANTNITALQGGLSGANTNIAARDTVANVYTTWNYLNSNINLKANIASPTFTGTVSTPLLSVTQSSGDEGGQIDLAKAVTNTTLTTGISIDVYQNKLRIFETGGTNRGVYIDLTATAASVGSNLLAGSGSSIPAGGIIMYGANTAPSGWLACDGTAVSRTTYATLFTAIGNTFGVGDGSTTFNLPDFRGRTPYGVDASQSLVIGGTSAGKINTSYQNSTGTGTTGTGTTGTGTTGTSTTAVTATTSNTATTAASSTATGTTGTGTGTIPAATYTTGTGTTGTGTTGTSTTGTGTGIVPALTYSTGTGTTGTGTTGTGTTGTSTTGAGGGHTHTLTTVAYQQPVLVKDQTPNYLVTAVSTIADHTHTAPGLSVPGLSVPGLSIPALSIPAMNVSVPGLSVPGLSVPGLSIPALSIPAMNVSVPGLSIPALTIPSLTVNTHTHNVPALTVPGLSIPGLSIPGLSVPALTVTHPATVVQFIIKT